MSSFVKNNISLLNYCQISYKKVALIYFLSFTIAILETTGIGMLLPIGEYLLNINNSSSLETTSWKILFKIFNFFGLEPSIIYVVSLAIAIIITRQIFTYVKLILSVKIQQEISRKLRRNFFANLIESELKFSKSFKTGSNANLVSTEIHKTAISGVTPFDIVTGILLLLSYFFMMMILSLKATLLIIIIGLFLGFIVKILNRKLHVLSKNIINLNNNFTQHFVERLKAIKLIKLNNLYKKEYLTNSKILNEQYKINVHLARIQGLTATGLEPLVISVLLPILVISVQLGVDLSILGMYAIVLARVVPTFKVIIGAIQSFIRVNASCERILTNLKESSAKKEIRDGKKEFPKSFKKISLNNIYFKYLGADSFTLKNFSAVIKANKINAIVGPSGIGKTTLIDMLPLLIEPTKGNISIDNLNTKLIDINSLRRSFAYVDQNPFFFKGSIIENLSYCQNTVNKNICIKAAKLAKADSFIKKLPGKYEYMLGETGAGLSGGQLQRLEIAKALATERKIIILDEPTSNLDEKNSNEILNTLTSINKKTKATIIIISHKSDVMEISNNLIRL